jgi:hypothetical protein
MGNGEHAMNYTETDYQCERALVDADNEWMQQFRKPNGWIVISKEEQATRPANLASVDNDMRGRVDQFELLRDKPARFSAYLAHDCGDGVGSRLPVTVWTGLEIGSAVVRSIGSRRGLSSTRQRYGRAVRSGARLNAAAIMGALRNCPMKSKL